jgi:putative membrane protein insertion efficiency factor
MTFRPRTVARSLIRLYQKAFSPALLSTCRFTPTCSDFALEAIERHGVLVGGALAAWRIARCNPFTHGGFDHVPVSLKHHQHRIHSREIEKPIA